MNKLCLHQSISVMIYPQGGICIHYISTRSICIMTYPLKDICTIRFLHLHLYKKTFASRLNMCAGTIMDKLCICTPAWDICIMKVASLKKRHVHHMDILHLHPCKKAFTSEMKNLDLHHILFAFIEE